MCEVYTNAFCTFAAVASPNSNGGLFHGGRKETQLTVRDTEETSSDLALSISHAHDAASNGSPHVDLLRSPLKSRGWAMQEQYLSRRIVRFEIDGITFECPSSYHCTCGYERSGVHDASGDTTLLFSRGHKMVGNLTYEDMWMLMMEEYSSRRLSRPRDKLPATAGLARAFQEHFDATSTAQSSTVYLAGLWTSDIARNLAWWVDWDERYGLNEPDQTYANLMPSWSWASIDSKVAFKRDQTEGCIEISSHMSYCTPAGPDPYGEIAPHAYITVRGQLMTYSGYREWTMARSIEHVPESCVLNADEPWHYRTREERIKLLEMSDGLLVLTQSSGSRCWLVLASVQSSSQHSAYRRLGLMVEYAIYNSADPFGDDSEIAQANADQQCHENENAYGNGYKTQLRWRSPELPELLNVNQRYIRLV